MLLVLLLGVADFGRVFQAGITIEAATRNGAEAAAQEYLQLSRGASLPLPSGDYQRIHDIAIESICEESVKLPDHVSGSPYCAFPAVAVCIHDGYDPLCAAEAPTAPGQCSSIHAMASSPASSAPYGANGGQLPNVEVRTCYRFTTLFNLTDLSLPFGNGLSIGEIWLQKDRTFTVASYL
jgi:hypothetical protein